MYINIKWPHLFACVCPRKGGLIVFGCLQLLPWRMQFHLSFIFPHLDCIRINCNASKFSLKFHFCSLGLLKKNKKHHFLCYLMNWFFSFLLYSFEKNALGFSVLEDFGEGACVRFGMVVFECVWEISPGQMQCYISWLHRQASRDWEELKIYFSSFLLPWGKYP